MEKTTLYLDPAAYRTLKRIAAESGRAPAALVREAVAEYVARHGRARVPGSVGAFGSGRADLSERAEELLDGFGGPSHGTSRAASTRTPRARKSRAARGRR